MAIKIPSKNIYEMENPKVRDNVIDNVSIEQTIVKPNNEYEVSVYNTKEENIKNTFFESDSDSSTYIRTASTYEYQVTALFTLVKAYYFNFSIKVPRLIGNFWVSTLIDKQEDIVKATVYTREKSGIASGVMQHSLVDNKDYIIATNIITNYTSEKPTTINSLSNYENKISFETTTVDIYGETLFAKIEIQDNSSIKSPIIEEHDDYYIISASVLVGKEEISLYGYNKKAYTLFPSVSGKCTYYEPTQIEITIYGNTIGIDLTNGSITYGSGNKPFSLSGNELLQDSSTILTNTTERPTTEYLYGWVKNQYEKGKETATLLCDISDYYKENGEKVIDIKGKKMTFHLHDEVIPYVFGADGKDKPMSNFSDGSPKVFEVVGSKVFYDGAVWQEICLQEKNKKLL